MKKRILSMFLVVVMLVTMIPTFTISSFATTSGTTGDCTWSLVGAKLTISGNGAMEDYYTHDAPWGGLITELIIEDGVTTIGAFAFFDCDISNLTIPNSVTIIGDSAFFNCCYLSSITIGSGVTTIGDSAFWIGDSLTTVNYLGSKCQWDKISIGIENPLLTNSTITYELGEHAYNSVVTPPTCTEQGYTTYTCVCGDSYVDDYVDALGHIDNDNNGYCDECSEYFCTATGTCGDNLTWEFDKITGKLTIFGTGDMYDFEVDFGGFTISPFADFAKEVEHIVVGDDVTSVGDFAFDNFENLETISLGSSITRIGRYAFNGCYLLTNITLPDGLKEIDSYAFKNCTSLTNVTFPDSLEIIGSYAFAGCESFSSVTIPINVQSIDNGAFYSCSNLKDVYYEGTKEQLGEILPWFSFDPVFSNAKRHYNSTGADTHPYKPVITPPTCTEQGYTTYTCDCGYSNGVDNYVDATGHNYSSEITTPTTHTETGIKTFTCSCGDSYTEVIEKIEEHNYESVVTAPTCTEQGYTTYTCECGDSYVDDYVDATGHNYIDNVCTDCGDRIIINGWQLEDGKWAYYVNGEKLTNKWIKDSVGWCYVGADGYCVTNCWKADSKGWCYLDENGRMVINNWVLDNGKWYFMDANGYMVSNCWKKDSIGWCYLGASGAMLTNAWVKDSVGWCYVGADGYCVTNKWVKDSVGWCYLDANGRMVTNKWVKDSVGWCFVGSNGYMVYNQWVKYNNQWYYIDANGYMVTGTKVVGDKTYKFNSNGVWIG